jgi:hypothetical protein
VEELCILSPFTSYSELSRQLQAKFTLWVVPSESEERPTLLLEGEHKEMSPNYEYFADAMKEYDKVNVPGREAHMAIRRKA